MKTARGFILQATYRVSGSDEARVPVVHLYGRLEDGGTFVVRDDRRRPHFYISSTDAERAAGLGAPRPAPGDRRTFEGAPVSRVTVATPSDVPPLHDRLHDAGIDTFEADVRFASRYLIERGIKGGCEIAGEAAPGNGIGWEFRNPTIHAASVVVLAARAVVRYRDGSERADVARDFALRARRRRGSDRRSRGPSNA